MTRMCYGARCFASPYSSCGEVKHCIMKVHLHVQLDDHGECQ